MSHFLTPYAGNKRQEYKEIEPHLKFDNVKNIIEPFCGTSAISFNIWKKHGNKFDYYLNDKSENLYKIYKLLQEEDIDVIEKNINDIKNSVKNKEDYLKIHKNPDKSLYEYIYINRYYALRPGLFSEAKCITAKGFMSSKIQREFIEFIKSPNVYITNDNWDILFEKYKNDAESLFMLDPPYIQSCNNFYGEKDLNVYEYLFENNIGNFKSKIYLMLENNWMIKLLFKGSILYEYNKQYQTTHRNTTHLIIGNC